MCFCLLKGKCLIAISYTVQLWTWAKKESKSFMHSSKSSSFISSSYQKGESSGESVIFLLVPGSLSVPALPSCGLFCLSSVRDGRARKEDDNY